jgi:folate-dependent phosphoribosylglycinamide formyltransferase PurN
MAQAKTNGAVTRIAVLCRENCGAALETIKLFRKHGREVALLVIETAVRTKFSASELVYKRTHQDFHRMLLDQAARAAPARRGLVRTSWAVVPAPIRQWIKCLLGRGESPSWPSLEGYAAKLRIPVVRVDRHSCEVTRASLERADVTYALLTSSAWLLKDPLLSLTKARIINVHPGKLPRHRSLDSMPWSVVEHDQVGVTAHFIDQGIDTGPILRFLEVRPAPGDNLMTLRQKLEAIKPAVFLQVIQGLEDGSIVPIAQKESEGVHHRPMTLDELLKADSILQQSLRVTAVSS